MTFSTLLSRAHFRFAGAAALALSGALAVAPQDAAAQERSGADFELSREFREIFGDAQSAFNGGDLATAQAETERAAAIAANDDENFLVGQYLLNIGTQTSNQALQQRGLEILAENSNTSAEDRPRWNFFLGQFAYRAEDYQGALTRFQRAQQLGYPATDLYALIANSYLQLDRPAEAASSLAQAVDAAVAAGETPPEQWLRTGFSITYNNNLTTEAREWSRKTVRYYPTGENWRTALLVLRDSSTFNTQQNLDLMRLLRETGGMASEADYAEYVENADVRRLPGEVVAVIDEGRSKGDLTGSNSFFNESYDIASDRVADDRGSLAESALDSQAEPDGSLAIATADAYLGYGDNADAIELYELAMTKGGVDADLVYMRTGIAQLRMGAMDEARASFAQVSGPRQPIAEFWMIYLDQVAG